MTFSIETTKETKHDLFIEREEIWRMEGNPDTFMHNAYSYDGGYIGSIKDAWHLCVDKGIKPEKRTPENNAASVGIDRDGKWWGWSHRAIARFDTREQAAEFAESVS